MFKSLKRVGQLVFLAAAGIAAALYALTAPDGLPWNASSHLALAYLGEVVRFPAMPHPVWGFHVRVFYGSVALSVVCAALAAGLLAAIVNRYFGWRFAAAAALVWIFLPGVWNRAITGERGICLAAMAVVAAWALNAVALRVLRKARATKRAARRSAPATVGGDVLGAPMVHDEKIRRSKVNRRAGWVAMGVAGVFALVSLTLHDYRYGEAASVFARGVVEAADGRIIVMNGVCDGQIVRELGVENRCRCRADEDSDSAGQHGSTPTPTLYTLSLRNDDAYRTNLVAWVRSAFPSATNFWVAAQVGPKAFVDVAVKSHSERFYLMNGKSTTPEQWEKRWEDFKPYLGSSDPFVPVARRLFGYEGNAVANAMLDGVGVENRCRCRAEEDSGSAGPSTKERDRHSSTSHFDSSTAWCLYKRIYTEIDPGNFSALVNMSEMIRRGHAVSGDERKWVQEKLETFFKDANNRKRLREIARASGPVRADSERMEKIAEEVRRRIAAKVAAGEKLDYSPEALSLLEWSHEMFALMDKGETSKAGRIARAILSNPKWRDYLPANAVMGAVSASEGDYVSSEAFFRAAISTTNKVAVVALNDYADTLMHLGKLDEAEKMARRAVAASDERYWVARLTLAQVLEKRAKVKARGEGEEGTGEIRALLKSVLRNAPAQIRERVRKELREYVR